MIELHGLTRATLMKHNLSRLVAFTYIVAEATLQPLMKCVCARSCDYTQLSTTTILFCMSRVLTPADV